jgi:hypothetical protein
LTTVSSQEARRPSAARAGRLLEASRWLRLWRVAAGLAALVLAAANMLAATGSMKVVQYAPVPGSHAAAILPKWAGPCSTRYPSVGETDIAFCARVDGRVIAWATKPSGETHLLVAGGFHLTLVELKAGMHKPGWGSRITAVGPLLATDGMRELRAVMVRGR